MDRSRHELGAWKSYAWPTGRRVWTPAGRTWTMRWTMVMLASAVLHACSAQPSHNARDPETTFSDQIAQLTVPSDDSVLSISTSLRKFRLGLKRPSKLSNAASTREELAQRFVAALIAHDTGALARVHLTRAEFAWLYYPENPVSQPPYSLPAGLAWFELHGESEKGMRRSLAAYGGSRLEYRGLECPNEAVRYGRNTLWNRCLVRVRDESGIDRSLQLFATIVERDGRLKIASAANDL